jgi:putative ABC transport system substrate-binding protein
MPRSIRALLSVGLTALLLPAQAQPLAKVRRVGYLAPVFACVGSVPSLEAFRQGLHELGYVEGRTIVIECRSAEGKGSRLPELATELSNLNVEVIVAAGGELVARAAKQANGNIPIVMTNVSDPVGTGLVGSLSHPGGSVTGLATISPELSGKRLELLKEAFPEISRVAVLMNPSNPEQDLRLKDLAAAALALRIQLQLLEVREPKDLDRAFTSIVNEHADALLPLGDPLVNSQRRRIIDFAAKDRLPAMYHRREFVDDGGLMVYGPSYNDLFRRAAGYVDKILRGAKPGDLPVEQPTKFELIVNVGVAKALGLTVPASLLLRADEVIQ